MTYRAGEKEASLWNEDDGFYYDAISWGGPWTQQYVFEDFLLSVPSDSPHDKKCVDVHPLRSLYIVALSSPAM